MEYRIGELAEVSGVSTKTLRYYDELRLLRPAAINPRTRYRRYSTEQLRDLTLILALQELGLSLSEIRRLALKTGANRRTLLLEFRNRLESSIEHSRQTLKCIDAALANPNDLQRSIAVVLKRRPSIAVASVRSQLKRYEDILDVEKILHDAIPSELVGTHRGVLWHRCADSGSLEGEAFVEVVRTPPRRSFYDVKHLPPVTAACAYSTNDDADAEMTYDAVRQWMSIRGFRLAGPKRELNLGKLLEIQFPLKH